MKAVEERRVVITAQPLQEENPKDKHLKDSKLFFSIVQQ